MKYVFKSIVLLFVVSYWPITYWAPSPLPYYNETNYFQFAIANYHTSRQSGQIIDLYVRYAYKKTWQIVPTLTTNYYELTSYPI